MDDISSNPSIDRQIAQRLKSLRTERGWSLEELAKRSAVSRATLSRLENTEVSATAAVLGRLCAAYGMTLSRLIRLVESEFQPLVHSDEQPVWVDPNTGYVRRSVSPPAQMLVAEALECRLEPGTEIIYEHPPRPGLEHHIILTEGELSVMVEGRQHRLHPGDCLRYQLFGRSEFRTGDKPAKYYLFMV
jgi:transcriptional regulator with XRE-family HTH domain